jgi:hypothetical protein
MSTSFAAAQWKPERISGDDVGAQRSMPFLAQVPEPHRLPAALVASTPLSGSFTHCLLICGKTDEDIAKAIHVSKGYMSKLLRSLWVSQLKRFLRFMRETHCISPLQVLAYEMGCELIVKASQSAEIAALKARLQDLERAA